MQNTIYIKHEIANVINIAKIITIHYFEYGKDYKFNGESHDFWEIIYSDKGHVCITRGEHEFMLEQGELVFLRPNLYHNICSDGNTRLMYLSFLLIQILPLCVILKIR